MFIWYLWFGLVENVVKTTFNAVDTEINKSRFFSLKELIFCVHAEVKLNRFQVLFRSLLLFFSFEATILF